MTSAVNKLNTLVTAFLTENAGAEDLQDLWTADADLQKKLKSLLTGASRAAQKKRDPNAPKRGKSAYLFFCAAHRSKVQTELGAEAKATEITAELGQRWKQLKENPKRKNELAGYEKQAGEDKARYLEEKSSYVPPDDLDNESRGGKRKKSPKDGPKRAKSAYLFFCDDMRPQIKEENPEMSATEITSELGRRWGQVKEQGEKAVKRFNDLAATDKARYEREKSEGVKPVAAKGKAPAAKPAGAKGKAAAKPAAAKGKAPAAKPAGAKGKAQPAKPAPEPVDEELVEEEEIIEEAAPQPSKGKAPAKGTAGKGRGKGRK